MTRPFRAVRALTIAVWILLVCFLLTGCKEETPPPSGSGYYSGPMKPKATATGDSAPKQQGTKAAGQP